MRNFEHRLKALETLERAQHDHCRGYIVLDEDGEIIRPCTCGRIDEMHKTYVAISPDDWDATEP